MTTYWERITAWWERHRDRLTAQLRAAWNEGYDNGYDIGRDMGTRKRVTYTHHAAPQATPPRKRKPRIQGKRRKA